MSFNWSDFLEIAELLHSKGKGKTLEQAYFRCALSRAYYAAFIISRKYAESKGESFEREYGRSHKHVIDYYINSKNPGLQDVGENLKTLKRWRINSDYEDNPVFNSMTVESSLKYSKNIISDLKL